MTEWQIENPIVPKENGEWSIDEVTTLLLGE